MVYKKVDTVKKVKIVCNTGSGLSLNLKMTNIWAYLIRKNSDSKVDFMPILKNLNKSQSKANLYEPVLDKR